MARKWLELKQSGKPHVCGIRHLRVNNIKVAINDELKKIDIKNHTCYYFDVINNINDVDLDNILVNEKSYGNYLIYDLACKTVYVAKPLGIIFVKAEGYVENYDGTKYLALFHSDKKI